MGETLASLLIVDGDPDFGRLLAGEAEARAYRARAVTSVREGIDSIRQEPFDAVLVDLAPGAESAFELLAEIKQNAAETEVIVMSNRTSMAAAIQWFDPNAFAFVRKSDVVQLFAALGRAIERRRITAQNRRLVWELQTINEIASGLTRSLQLDDVLMGALQQLVQAMDAAGGSIRLRDELTGEFPVGAIIGPPLLQQLWPAESARIERPSDRVIATGAAFVVEDFAELVEPVPGGPPLPLRSAISVPMFAGDQLTGTLSLGSMRPRRFSLADQRLLAIIAGQVMVAAQNAQLHQSIWRAKHEWERTFDAINDPIAVFDEHGELLRGNRALASHLSRPITALRNLTCAQVGFCGERAGGGCEGRCSLRHGGPRRNVTLADGRIFNVTTFPIALPGAGPSVVQVAKNVTEEHRNAERLQRLSDELAGTNGRLVAAMEQLKSTQAQLVQVEKLSALGHLVAGVAHELNNPLTSVIGYSQLLEEELREGPGSRPAADVAEDLRRIADESERAARIVRNLLSFARRQTVARAPRSVSDVCARVLALREYEFRMTGVVLAADLPPNLPLVLADEGQLQQVLLNLVLNAEQAMRGAETKRLVIAVSHDGASGAVDVSITDSGHGIEPANLPRIFDPFFTTREVGEGTGLGLSICYGIVRDHGGQIRVESKPQVGTTVRVSLPAHATGGDAATTPVLIAHPEQSDREFLVAALHGWGHPVRTAETAEEALDVYASGAVRLAIVDRTFVAANMETWRRLRSADVAHLPLILTSLAPDDRAMERFVKEEASAALVPPFELRALHAAVRAGAEECV
ncbi:MAG: ATP-binding protein [Vicinamibacterales bacterium]